MEGDKHTGRTDPLVTSNVSGKQDRDDNADDIERHKKELLDVNSFFQEYRRTLAIRIILTFAIIFLLILELVFNKTIYESFEVGFVKSIQSTIGFEKGDIPFLNTISSFLNPYWIFLVLTHIMFTIYFGVNAIFGAKIMLCSLVVFSISKILNLVHREPRPFWGGEEIVGYGCNATFANPDLSLITIMFFFGYTQHCFSRRYFDSTTNFLQRNIFRIIGLTLVISLSLLKLASGELFITQIVIMFVYSYIFLYVAEYLDESIDIVIERSTFRATVDNKFILNYFLIILLALVMEIMLFIDDNTDMYSHMTYLHNFLKCLKRFEDGSNRDPIYLNQVVGWYPTFHEGAYLVAILGAILGISRSFRTIQKESFWFKASGGERMQRVIWANVWVGFAWIAGYFRSRHQTTLDSVGIRAFYANCFIVYLLYYVPLGLMPIFLFARLHKGGVEGVELEEDTVNEHDE